MASKVNTKFVLILGASLAIAAGGVAGIMYTVLAKSAADHLKSGEALMAAGDYEKAVIAYGKAVSKEPNNPEFLAKWVAAMEKTQPTTYQGYVDRYNRSYMRAMERIAEVKRTDLAAHKSLLEPQFQQLRVSASDPRLWLALISEVERKIALFPPNDTKADVLRRYRGLSRVGLMKLAYETSDEDRAQAKADLEAALAADPKDELVVAGLIDWAGFQAGRWKAKNDNTKAAAALDEARALAGKFIQENPPAACALLALTQLETRESVTDAYTKRDPRNGDFYPQLISSLVPRATKVLEAISQTPAANLDEPTIWQGITFAIGLGVPTAYEAGATELARVLATRPNDPVLMYQQGELAFIMQKYREAIDFWQKVVDLPDRPISREGMLLYGIRDQAVARQAVAALGLAEQAKSAEDRKKALAEARALRDKVAARSTSNESIRLQLLLLDGRLAISENKLVEARQLLNQYNEQTLRKDAEAIRVLAGVLMRLNDLGPARENLQRLVALNAANTSTFLALAEVEGKAGRYVDALHAAEAAADKEGNGPQRDQIAEQIEVLKNQITPSDPIFKAVAESRLKMEATKPDPAAALAVLRAADIKKSENIGAMMQLGLLILQLGGTEEEVRAIYDRAKSLRPDDARLKTMELALSAPHDLNALIKTIDDNNALTEFQKSLQKYVVYMRMGHPEEAAAAFKKAEELQPEHPIVISKHFEDAVADRKWDEAAVLAEKAAKADMDQMHGLIFRTRLLSAQGKINEAATLAQQVTEQDPLNAIGWRVLGQLRLEQGKYADGLTAMQRALQIKPDEAQNIIGVMQAQLLLGQPTEALKTARDGKTFAIGDPDFLNMWLRLETDSGDAALALERRRMIFQNEPANMNNTGEYIRMLIKGQLWEECDAAVKLLETNKMTAQAAPFRAMYHTARQERDLSLAVFNTMLEAVPEAKREGGEHIQFARAVMGLGDKDQAIAVLEAGLKYEKPGSMIVSREIGDVLFNTGDYEKSIVAYRRALDSVKKDADNLLALRIADAHLKLKQYDKAMEIAAATKAANDQAQVRLYLVAAQANYELHQYDKARDQLAKALRIDPRNPIVFYKRAEVGLNDPAMAGNTSAVNEATKDLEQVLQLNPLFLPARQLLASTLSKNGQLDRGFALMREGLNLDPTNEELRDELVNQLIAAGRVSEALTLVEDAVTRSSSPRWTGMAADLYAGNKDFGRAADMYSKLWERRRDVPTAERYVTMLLSKSPPDIRGARDVLATPELEIDKKPILLLLRARCGVLEKRPSDWVKDTKAALAATDQNNLVQVNTFFTQLLRQVFMQPGDPGPRIAEADQFITSLKPKEGWTEPMEMTICILRLADDTTREAAMARLREISASSKVPDIIYGTSRIVAGDLFQKKQYSEALQLFERARTLYPKNGENLTDIAQVMSKGLGRHDEALPLALNATELVPQNAAAWTVLGQIYVSLSKWDEAAAALTRARQLTNDSFIKAPPTIYLIEVKLAKGDRTAADELNRELRQMIDREREPKRIAKTYREDLDRIDAKLRGAN